MNLLRNLPKVDVLLKEDEVKKYIEKLPRKLVVENIRNSINIVRENILKMGDYSPVFSLKEQCLMEFRKSIKQIEGLKLRRVINCTGTVIHTNLGRSILSKRSIEALNEVANNYSNLEYNLSEGKRGSRYDNVLDYIKYLTGAEDALVVNNNAAAVLITLNTVCNGKEGIISRGELVEIGGSFRIPEIMKLSGGILKEVGTTNRTHIKDYEEVISEETGAIIKVHTSNYKILGFTKEVEAKELISIKEKNKIPVILDLGSGLIKRVNLNGIEDEKTVKEYVNEGVDIITFSGDKLLGGPQCGIIVGKSFWIEKIKKNQLNRALRVDKFTLAALEGTLKDYILEDYLSIPTLKLLTLDLDVIEDNIDKLKEKLKFLQNKFNITKAKEKSLVGGGALPTLEFDTFVLKIDSNLIKENKIEEKLRNNSIPIITRINGGKVIIDGRCLINDDIEVITEAFKGIGESI